MKIECMPSFKLKFILMLIFFSIIRGHLRLRRLPKFTKVITPNSILIDKRMDVPQSFLGTCTVSKQTEFQLATSGLSPCVGLTYFCECPDNNTFTMLAHFDSGHIDNINTYITAFIETIPDSCEDGTFTVNIVNPLDSLPGDIQKALKNLNKNYSVINHTAKGLGVDLAIDTGNGKIQQYKDLSPKMIDGGAMLKDVFNKMDGVCKLYYIGKERLCRLEQDYELAFNYDHDLHKSRPPYPNSYLYAFIPKETPSYSDSCDSKDIDLN